MDIAELRDKLKAELAVVEKFFEIAKAHGGNGVATKDAAVSTAGANAHVAAGQTDLKMQGLDRKYGALAETVQEGIKLAPDRYTIADLFEILAKIGKPLEKGQISTVLNRMAEREKIFIHRRGKGSRATIFKKVKETAE